MRALGMMLVALAGALAIGSAVKAQPTETRSPGLAAIDRRDFPAARALFEEACKAGQSDGCGYLGLMLINGAGGAPDVARGRSLLEAGCARGDAGSCWGVAQSWKLKDGADLAKARAALERSCTLEVGSPCVELSTMLLRGQGGPTDRAAAIKILERTCAANNAQACAMQGMQMANASAPGGANYPAAAKLLLKGCDLGEPAACPTAGRLLRGFQNVPKDEVASFRAMAAGCAGGNVEACSELNAYDAKIATTEKVQASFEKACLGKAIRCVDAGVTKAELATTPEAFEAGAALAGKACAPSEDGPRACQTRDRLRAIATELRTCQGGTQAACGRMSALMVRTDDEYSKITTKRFETLPKRHAKAACDAGSPDGCAAQAWLVGMSANLDGALAQMPQAMRACASRVTLGCEYAGRMAIMEFDERMNLIGDLSDRYSDNDADWQRLQASWQTTKSILKQGCDAGWAEGCIALVVRQPMMERGQAPGEAAVRAACNKTWAHRCYQLAATLLVARFARGPSEDLLESKLGCAVDKPVCEALGRWYQGQGGNSPNGPFRGQYAALGVAMMDWACAQKSVNACVFMGIYHSPTDPGALAQRQPNWPLAAGYARQILAIDPTNWYGRDLARRAAEKGL